MSGWPKYKEVVRERDQFKRERDELLVVAKECVAYIEMKLAHDGPMSVEQIMDRLRDIRHIASVETSHHAGCRDTTRTVNLDKARKAIEQAQGGAK